MKRVIIGQSAGFVCYSISFVLWFVYSKCANFAHLCVCVCVRQRNARLSHTRLSGHKCRLRSYGEHAPPDRAEPTHNIILLHKRSACVCAHMRTMSIASFVIRFDLSSGDRGYVMLVYHACIHCRFVWHSCASDNNTNTCTVGALQIVSHWDSRVWSVRRVSLTLNTNTHTHAV